MSRSKILRSLGLLAVAATFAVSAHAQIQPANHFELASHARTKARSLSDAHEFEAALAVLNSLEAGKYEVGDAVMQAAAAKIQGVMTDRARILLRLGRYDQADGEYYKAFDTNVAKVEKELTVYWESREQASTSPKEAELAAAAMVAAKGALSLADGVVTLRESNYLVAGVLNSAKPFDAARMAKYAALEKRIERAMKR